ncbi:hypothetical protein [Pseudoclavibacter sp. VKM Ac-2888]|uniref:hypothetical protein n=1 Tax=Pseudoclavibacter sp. VKM Ac-2888 TaxID=2783830 RepID=UPI001E527C17|nr:hypothetical protein [Pseudoclavibacter sp. VKM Ac-2888]
MSGPVLERVDLEELFEGWSVVIGEPPHDVEACALLVVRRRGEMVLRAASGDWWPFSLFEGNSVYRVHAALPDALGYYVTEDPDHEVIERSSKVWRSTNVAGTPLSDAEVREMGALVHHVPASQVAFAEMHARHYQDAAARAETELSVVLAALAEARAEVAPAHAAGRAEALGEVWSFLRARGLWWRPVRRAVARHFGRSLVGGDRA